MITLLGLVSRVQGLAPKIFVSQRLGVHKVRNYFNLRPLIFPTTEAAFISVTDLHSKVLDLHPRPRGPNSFNFMQFLGKFSKIICWATWGVGAPTSGKS